MNNENRALRVLFVREREIVIASGNPGKLREIEQLFSGYGIRILPQSAFSVSAAAETGDTFAENALIKAKHAAAHTGLSAIADDSGLAVDGLDGAPGVRSARYAGEQATDSENLALLLRNLAAVEPAGLSARYHCAMVYVSRVTGNPPLLAQASWEGRIVRQAQGAGGFGYDPIFHVPEQGCTAAQLAPEVKNAISHRGQALRQLLEKMRQAGALPH